MHSLRISAITHCAYREHCAHVRCIACGPVYNVFLLKLISRAALIRPTHVQETCISRLVQVSCTRCLMIDVCHLYNERAKCAAEPGPVIYSKRKNFTWSVIFNYHYTTCKCIFKYHHVFQVISRAVFVRFLLGVKGQRHISSQTKK